MKQFFIKYWWAPVVIAAIIAGWQYKLYVDKNKAANFGEKQPAPPKVAVVVPGNTTTNTGVAVVNNFPLKVGSKNQYVGSLQEALGVTVDNIFGKKETLPALKAQTGKTQINDLADLNATISLIKENNAAPAIIAQKTARADTLIGAAATHFNIQLLNNSTWIQYIEDAATGELIEAGYVLNWKKGQKLSLADYQLTETLQSGNLLITVSKVGSNTGLWVANPLDINLI